MLVRDPTDDGCLPETDQCDDGCLPETDQCDNMHWRVRRPITSLFTGRTELLDRIRSVFRVRNDPNSQKQQRFVITGMGGLGKSEVCLQIANLLREECVTPASCSYGANLHLTDYQTASGVCFGSTSVVLRRPRMTS